MDFRFGFYIKKIHKIIYKKTSFFYMTLNNNITSKRANKHLSGFEGGEGRWEEGCIVVAFILLVMVATYSL